MDIKTKSNLPNIFKSAEISEIDKGIYGKNFYIIFKNKYFYIQQSDIQCFKVSEKRVKNTMCIKLIDDIKKIFISNIKNITVEKCDKLYYLQINYMYNQNLKFISTRKIKLKEIHDFINIKNSDSVDMIIKKQHDKILLLLEKIKTYEDKELDTDEELITVY